MVATSDKIKQLREITGAGVMDCKRALEHAKGDMEKAKEEIIKKGVEIAAKKATRTTSQGRIVSYIHHNHKVGALVEVNCETDFVAKNEDFAKFTRDVAMHIVAARPVYVKKEDVSKADMSKNEKAEDFYKRTCLLEQPFVRDESMTIGAYMTSLVAKTGENINIKRFVCFGVGE